MSETSVDRRTFLKTAVAAGLAAPLASAAAKPPNVVMIYVDDMGWGDLGCYGSNIKTPNIDRMAAEGIRFTNFYSANPVCSPSRAALLTGRYPTRVGVPRVFFPGEGGLPATETTIPQMLKPKGYKSMCIGKWHLGDRPEFLPTNRGFDEYFGIPYSNDMVPRVLMHNTEVIEKETPLDALTQKYTREALSFIDRSKDSPFFLYLPHTYPHIPLDASPKFKGKSSLGIYGDVVEELDWSVGEVLSSLKKHGLEENTLVMFSSDNGPWYQGSPGPYRGRKGDTSEGGVREPFIAKMPGRTASGKVCDGVACTIDILPTIAKLCDVPLPEKPVDGIDIWPMLSGKALEQDREALLFFNYLYLQCARKGRYKLHIARFNSWMYSPQPSVGRVNLPLKPVELYDVVSDRSESYDLAAEHPEVVADLQARIERLMQTFPENIKKAYTDTLLKQTTPTPAGAYPRLASDPIKMP